MTDRILWAAWWVGAIVVALSWLSFAPVWTGWAGFALAGMSTLVSVVRVRYWRPSPIEGDKSEPEG